MMQRQSSKLPGAVSAAEVRLAEHEDGAMLSRAPKPPAQSAIQRQGAALARLRKQAAALEAAADGGGGGSGGGSVAERAG